MHKVPICKLAAPSAVVTYISTTLSVTFHSYNTSTIFYNGHVTKIGGKNQIARTDF